jgi:glycosyltransferase involved in cell wall biosynthesis
MSCKRTLSKSERQADNPLVSIITPVLNGERCMSDTVKSVLAQTYSHIEHIVIDGNSADNTVSLVKALNPRAIVVSESDRGVTDAINKGLRIASGEIIALLNYDDYYADSDVIQSVVSEFLSKPDAMVIYGKVKCIHPQTGETLFLVGNPSRSREFSFRKMREVVEGKTITYPGTFAKREVYDNIGPFSFEYDICTDYEYYLRIIKLYEPVFK